MIAETLLVLSLAGGQKEKKPSLKPLIEYSRNYDSSPIVKPKDEASASGGPKK